MEHSAHGAQPLTDQATDAEERWVVWKFPLPIRAVPVIAVPSGAKFLSVAVQGDNLVAYFLCDTQMRQEPAERRFLIRETGTEAPSPDAEDWVFVGTHAMAGGGLMWHVWVEV